MIVPSSSVSSTDLMHINMIDSCDLYDPAIFQQWQQLNFQKQQE
jgi:hypothetical protein